MAEENAGEHQDRGLFGLFGKKKEEETHQQHVSAVDPHMAGVTPHEQGHVGEAHPVPVSHGHVEEGKVHGEGVEKKQEGGLMAKLHRSNSSSSSSSSDEEEDEKGEKKKKKKKGGLKDKIKLHEKKEEDHGHGKTEEEGEKKGLMEKIKEKLPGHNKEEEKEH